MNTQFLINSAVVLVWFYVSYYFIFSRVKWLVFNRALLLVGLVASVLFSCFNFSELLGSFFPIVSRQIQTIPVEFEQTINLDFLTENEVSTWIVGNNLFFVGYAVVVIFLLSRLTIRILKITTFIKKAHKVYRAGILICESEDQTDIFSFFNHIIIPAGYAGKDINYIIQHEQAHVRQWHSVDILLAELYAVIFWINPLSWLFRKLIKENHEFLADDLVVANGTSVEKSDYKMMILRSQVSGEYAYVVNTFSYPPYKKRITMIDKTQISSTAKIGYVLCVSVLMMAITFSNAFSYSTGSNTFYDSLDTSPEYLTGKEQLMRDLSRNIRYPEIARNSHAQGTFIVTFVVDKEGTVKDIKIADKIPSSSVLLNELIVVGHVKTKKFRRRTQGRPGSH